MRKGAVGTVVLVILLGAIAGTLLGEILSDLVPALRPLLEPSVGFGLPPTTLDLSAVSVTFGLGVRLDAAGLAGVLLALFVARKF